RTGRGTGSRRGGGFAAFEHGDRDQEAGGGGAGGDPAPHRRIGLRQVRRQGQQDAADQDHGGPRQPPRGPSGLLVALAFGGGHDAGQVDAYGDGPGHPAGLAVFGGGVADVGERPGRRDTGQHHHRPGVGHRAQQPVHAAR